jgi:hypothetical protein
MLALQRGAGNRAMARALSDCPPAGSLQRTAAIDLFNWQLDLDAHPEQRTDGELREIWLALTGRDLAARSGADAGHYLAVEARIRALNAELLANDDVGAVHGVLALALRPAPLPQEVAAAKRFLFDSDTAAFTPEDYVAWRRLAAGRGTGDDVRFMVHVLVKIRALGELGLSIDPTAHHGREDEVAPFLDVAHRIALEHEARFLAASVRAQFGRRATWQQVARSHPTRRDELLVALAAEEDPASLPATPNVAPDVAALEHRFAHYFDRDLGGLLEVLAGRPASRYATQVWLRSGVVKRSTNPATYWQRIGFVLAQTAEGPVWSDPRNVNALLHRVGGAVVVAPQLRAGAPVLPTRADIIQMQAGLHPDVGGINSDTITGYLQGAARQVGLNRQAAYLVFNIVRGHVFNDANKRTGSAIISWICAHNRPGAAAIPDTEGYMLRAADVHSGYRWETLAADLAHVIPAAVVGAPGESP